MRVTITFGPTAPSAIRTSETSVRTLPAAVWEGASPHISSSSRSMETTWFASIASVAIGARRCRGECDLPAADIDFQRSQNAERHLPELSTPSCVLTLHRALPAGNVLPDIKRPALVCSCLRDPAGQQFLQDDTHHVSPPDGQRNGGTALPLRNHASPEIGDGDRLTYFSIMAPLRTTFTDLEVVDLRVGHLRGRPVIT